MLQQFSNHSPLLHAFLREMPVPVPAVAFAFRGAAAGAVKPTNSPALDGRRSARLFGTL
jgi:hypothetical protein